MATTQPPLTSYLKFLKDGIRIPTRNPGLFGPIWALTIAEAALYIPWINGEQPATFAAITILLTSVPVSSIVAAVTTSAGVVSLAIEDTEHDNDPPGFIQILRVNVFRSVFYLAVTALACWSAFISVLISLIHNLVWYTSSLLILDILFVVHVVAGFAEIWFNSIVVPIAVVMAVSEPWDGSATVLRRALSVTAENADRAAIFVLLRGVVVFVVLPRDGLASGYSSVALLYVLMSGTLRVYSVCAVTAFYHECISRSQMAHAPFWQLIATGNHSSASLVPGRVTKGFQHYSISSYSSNSRNQLTSSWLFALCCVAGKEWLHGLAIRFLDGLKEVLQGRSSVRDNLAAMVDRVRRWCVWVLFFISNHPWVAGGVVICAARLISEGPSSMLHQNGAVRYRNYLKQRYNIHHRSCESMAMI